MKINFVSRGPLMDPDPGAGGGNGAGPDDKPGFDAAAQAAFKAEILGELNKGLNGVAKGLTKEFKTMFEALKPVPPPDPGDTPPDSKPDDKNKPDPEKNALQLRIKQLEEDSNKRIKALEQTNLESSQKAERAERESLVRSAVGKFSFVSDAARDTAFQIINPSVTRTDDGALVAGDLPFDKFIENELPAKHAYLLAPKDTGSAGSRPGKSNGTGKKWDFERDLKPENFAKLNTQEQAELRNAVATAL